MCAAECAAECADEHWSVVVFRGGEKIVAINSNILSGREIGPEDEVVILTAARHLLSFIGDDNAAEEYP